MLRRDRAVRPLRTGHEAPPAGRERPHRRAGVLSIEGSRGTELACVAPKELMLVFGKNPLFRVVTRLRTFGLVSPRGKLGTVCPA